MKTISSIAHHWGLNLYQDHHIQAQENHDLNDAEHHDEHIEDEDQNIFDQRYEKNYSEHSFDQN